MQGSSTGMLWGGCTKTRMQPVVQRTAVRPPSSDHLLPAHSHALLLDPGGALVRRDARGPSQVLKVLLGDCIEAEGGDVGASDGAGLALDHIDNAVGRVVLEASGADDGELEVLARAGEEELLLLVLVGEDLLHHGEHEHFKEEGRLPLRVSGSDGRDHSNALDTVRLHRLNDVGGAVGEHRLAYIGRLSAQRDHHARHIAALKHFGDIGGRGHGALKDGHCFVHERRARRRATAALRHLETGLVAHEAANALAPAESLEGGLATDAARGAKDGDTHPH
mmetsp:Transcript_9304/g.30803  ORF Transcript_9304/g.30803 Transcript_9304/m.30803 type:complete len:279 (+) Transcript_9304:201-1037(+)